MRSKQVEAFIGTLSFEEAAVVSERDKNLPLISLTSPAESLPPTPFQSPIFFQMANDIIIPIHSIV